MFDLHCHSVHSDGALSVADLLQRARDVGVTTLSITDHDTIEGYLEACSLTDANGGLTLVSGVELSCTWGKVGVHVVGLDFDPNHQPLREALARQAQAREQRAEVIAERLTKFGFYGSYAGARQLAKGSQVGRPHFARYLVNAGYVDSIEQAFKRYLGAGKAGDVKAMWPSLETVIDWIVHAGGIAVLAHPLKYSLTGTRLRALLAAFSDAGGGGMEVLSGRQELVDTRYLVGLCKDYGLLGSVGSDFHAPAVWSELG